MNSPVFYKMFFYDDQLLISMEINQNNKEIQMTEDKFVDSVAFLNFIKFLYTDRIEFPELSVETIIGLMFCSETYDVPRLKTESGNALLSRLKINNVILLLETSLRFKDLELEKKCWVIIDNSPQTVFQSEAILGIKRDALFEIIKRTELAIDESQVLDVCLKWSEKECERNGLDLTEANKRQVLGKVFFEIRFPILPPRTIAELVRCNFLTHKESSDMLLRMKCGVDVPNAENKNSIPESPFKSDKRTYRWFFHK